ncbi:hybrid sensor histidine kinase/response regulator [Thioclava nitratireducens]|uniref:histidine kinase n=1 Tax=Thioclava nitratireducens TaxID=1915078 RepID=A0ABN4X6E1_9RHOB|nr:ATP-binding protein [Thioclava nitratireducens]AQS48036.1 hybrid sensor histidine kinase/response regulator [Thioclava nitratireducens]
MPGARGAEDQTAPDAGYKALMELIDDGFCVIQFIDGPRGPLSDYVHIEANSGYERHTGIDGIVGKTVFDVAPQDGDEWVKIYGEVLRTGEPLRFEREFVEVGRHIEVSARRVEPASKAQVAVLFRDITDRKQKERELRESQRRAEKNARHVARALSAGAILGTWVWYLDSETFDLDDDFSRSMGLDPARAVEGLTIEQIVVNVHEDDKPGLMAAIDRATQQTSPYAHQFRVRRADGRYHWVEANGRMESQTPRIFAGVLMDLDDRRAILEERDKAAAALSQLNETLEQRVEEQTAKLMQQEEKLRQAQKMEAVGQLTGGLAHDFNNLLTAISGSLEFVAKRLEDGRPEEILRYLEAARSSTERAAGVTQRLLSFSRQQSLMPKPTDVPQLVHGMEDLLRHTIGPHILIRTEHSAAPWPAMVDPNQLESALLNLCINSRDAMPDGGTITISTANEVIQDGHSELQPGNYLRLSVRDTGTGMSAEEISKAFDPYFTTKPSGKGTGLGLSMVYGFARQSGGCATIEADCGVGTTVNIFLPRSTAAIEFPTAQRPVAEAPAASADHSILVVDDEVIVRFVVVEALEEAGFTVYEAGNAADGLALLHEQPGVSVLLTDIGLPGGMTGRELASRAKESREDLKIIFMTGYDEEAATGPAQVDAEVLLKPFDFDEMVHRVKRLSGLS